MENPPKTITMNLIGKLTIGISILLVFFEPVAIKAYELDTHGRITLEAYIGSKLGEYLNRNLNITEKDRFEIQRTTYKYNDGSVVGWLREGSVREDDYFSAELLRFTERVNDFETPAVGI